MYDKNIINPEKYQQKYQQLLLKWLNNTNFHKAIKRLRTVYR